MLCGTSTGETFSGSWSLQSEETSCYPEPILQKARLELGVVQA